MLHACIAAMHAAAADWCTGATQAGAAHCFHRCFVAVVLESVSIIDCSAGECWAPGCNMVNRIDTDAAAMLGRPDNYI